ncbi:hypothetical protein DRH27_00160 [Candidatus Falkowbacteria bacterium]|nr:MAG: hypothetical protein DRH27_00160 [Candidatus Falkowbacteria bacterium]
MYLYRTILSQAFKNVWRNKYLWFFGLFAALVGSSGEIQVLFYRYDSLSEGLFPGFRRILETGFLSKETLVNIGQLARTEPFSLFMVFSLFIVFIALGVFILWLSISSQAALVNNAARIKTDKKHNFKEGLEVGMKNFWPVLGLNIFLKLMIFAIFVILSLPIISSIATGNFTATSLVFIISFLIYVPLAIILSFIIKYAVAYVVIRGSRMLESIKLGWQLFLKNWLISIEMAFILFFISFLAAIALLMLLLIFSIPFLFIIILFIKFNLYFYTWAVIVLAIVFYLLVILLTGAILSAFQVFSWTGLFIELIGKGGVSKLTRMFGKKD